MVVLWTLSETPGDGVTAELPGPSGNLLHVLAYGVLAALLLRAWVPLGASWRAPGAWPGIGSPTGRIILILVALAGIMDEIHQFFIPGRTCSVLDVVADVLGAVVVLTWPGSDAGRPRTPRPALLALAGGVAIALIGWLDRPFPDRVLENVLDAVFGS